MERSSLQSMANGLMALAIAFCPGLVQAEPYQLGKRTAQIPSGWSATQIHEPGMTLAAFTQSSNPDAATLFWLENLPIAAIAPGDLIKMISSNIGVSEIKTRQKVVRPNSASLIADGVINGKAVSLALYAGHSHTKHQVFGLVAHQQEFKQLNGEQLPLKVFNAGNPWMSASDPKGDGPTKVLANAGSTRLTERMLADTVSFAEFLAAQTLTLEDKQQLRQTIIAEFPSASEKDLKGYGEISTLMQAVRQLDTPKKAQVHRDMMNQIWFDLQKLDEPNPLMDIVYRYNPILGADDDLKLVAPRSAFDALLASNSFVGAQAGLKPLTQQQRDAFAEQVSKTYDTMNEKQKRYLADGEMNWIKLIAAWKTWNTQEQQKHLGIVGVSRIKTADHVAQVARNLEHWAGIQTMNQQIMKMVAGQGNMMVLEHFRGMLGTE